MCIILERKAVAVAMTPELAFVRIGVVVSGLVPGGVAVHARAGRRSSCQAQQPASTACGNCPLLRSGASPLIYQLPKLPSLVTRLYRRCGDPNQDGGDASAAWVASHRTW